MARSGEKVGFGEICKLCCPLRGGKLLLGALEIAYIIERFQDLLVGDAAILEFRCSYEQRSLAKRFQINRYFLTRYIAVPASQAVKQRTHLRGIKVVPIGVGECAPQSIAGSAAKVAVE